MVLTLEIDNRERDLANILTDLCNVYNTENKDKKDFVNAEFVVKPLDLGDAILRRTDGTCAIIFERKTLADLASSIVDGRHKSQNLRLISAMSSDRARVELICEVSLAKRHFLDPTCNLNPFPGTRMSAAALRGAILNGEIRDNIAATIVKDSRETANHILGRFVYGNRFETKFTNNLPVDSIATDPTPSAADALSIVIHKKKKSDNATSQTCFADMLNAIPGVGQKRALDIATHFVSMSTLIERLKPVSEFTTDDKKTKKMLAEVFKDVNGVGFTTAQSIYNGLF